MLPIGTTDLRKNNERRQWCVRKDLMQVDHYVKMNSTFHKINIWNDRTFIIWWYCIQNDKSRYYHFFAIASTNFCISLEISLSIGKNSYTFFLFVWLLIAWKWPLDPVSRPRMVFRCNCKHTYVTIYVHTYCFGRSFLLS